MIESRLCCRVVGMSFLVCSIGCGGSSSRLPVEGAVTFDGQPIAEGQINFIPAPGTAGPTAGSVISAGRYSVPAEKGLKPGKYRVEISALRATAQKTQTFNAVTGATDASAAYESYIPPRYNAKSELTAEVNAGGPNQFDFHLTP
jgi:hypothetical protein